MKNQWQGEFISLAAVGLRGIGSILVRCYPVSCPLWSFRGVYLVGSLSSPLGELGCQVPTIRCSGLMDSVGAPLHPPSLTLVVRIPGYYVYPGYSGNVNWLFASHSRRFVMRGWAVLVLSGQQA